MGAIGTIVSLFTALIKLITLAKEAYLAWRTIQHNKKTDKIIDAINRGDTIAIEDGLGNPDAGKPSGIGKIRDK